MTTSIFWTTNGIGDGAAAYTQAQLSQWLRSVFLADATTQGVLPGVGGEYAVSGTASPLNVAAGFAFVYGFPAWDIAAQSIVVPTPVIGTTGHRIVLRADWPTQTVRTVLLSSNDGVGTIPALTQAAGTRWEISLATLTINTGGVIALTDTRQHARANLRLNGSRLDDASVAAAKLAAGAVVTHLGFTPLNKAGDTSTGTQVVQKNTVVNSGLYAGAHLELRTTDNSRPAIGFHRSGNEALALYYNGGYELRAIHSNGVDGRVWTEHTDGAGSGLDADTLDGLQAFQFWRPDNDGAGSGLDADLVRGQRIQSGVAETAAASTLGVINISFPVAFSAPPVVTANSVQNSQGGIAYDCIIAVSNITATGCTLNWKSASNTTVSRIAISWIAIGNA